MMARVNCSKSLVCNLIAMGSGSAHQAMPNYRSAPRHVYATLACRLKGAQREASIIDPAQSVQAALSSVDAMLMIATRPALKLSLSLCACANHSQVTG
jgi:hypothetical protein